MERVGEFSAQIEDSILSIAAVPHMLNDQYFCHKGIWLDGFDENNIFGAIV